MGIIVAGVIILVTGWQGVDLLVSVLIGVIILAESVRMLRESAHILAECVPPLHLTSTQVAAAIGQVPGVGCLREMIRLRGLPGALAYGAVLLFVHALGRGVPIILAGTSTGALKQLQALDRWSPVTSRR